MTLLLELLLCHNTEVDTLSQYTCRVKTAKTYKKKGKMRRLLFTEYFISEIENNGMTFKAFLAEFSSTKLTLKIKGLIDKYIFQINIFFFC
jgi:hypothetical protein